MLLDVESFESHSVDYLQYRLDYLANYIVRSTTLINVADEVFECVQKARSLIGCIRGEEDVMCRPELTFTGARVRPYYNIPREQLLFFIDNKFTIADIASMCGVSERTVKRRFQEFGLSISAGYSILTDAELQEIIENILHEFPNCGYKRMTGFLSSCGLRVQQERIRRTMQVADPEGVFLRTLQLSAINRRRYSVYSPLALWHVDTNHKLIRYNIVIVSKFLENIC